MNGEISASQNPLANGGCSCAAHTRGRRLPRLFLLVLGIAIVAGVWFFRAPLRQHIFADGVLANDEPTPDVVQTMIRQAPDPRAALLTAWGTGKIVQREVAIQELSSVVPDNQPLPVSLRDMLLAAALDPDLDVRESALNNLDYRHDPALPALLAAQLRNFDPQVQLLGLMHLKHVPAKTGVPLVVPLLNDNNPEIVAWALKLLEDWSDENFGVKLADAIPVADEKTGLEEFSPESYTKTRAGAELAMQWWAGHKTDFPPVDLKIPAASLAGLKPIYAGDFSLPDLDGRQVRLSDFRGKVVLINFWTTWCTACVGEIPELIALQKSHNDDLKILGVSLDAVPDDDSHSPLPPVDAIRAKFARTVKSRGINYKVLLDEKDVVGGRFNGGELPTTVIVDAQGRIRRRFIGPRSLPVFEAMIAEASKPMPPIQTDDPVAKTDQRNSAAAMRAQLAR
jgi:thiol-disulfide isomerase/thioredoxin